MFDSVQRQFILDQSTALQWINNKLNVKVGSMHELQDGVLLKRLARLLDKQPDSPSKKNMAALQTAIENAKECVTIFKNLLRFELVLF